MGELLREALEDEGTIICINGSPTDNNVELVFGGFKKALRGSDILIDETGYADRRWHSAHLPQPPAPVPWTQKCPDPAATSRSKKSPSRIFKKYQGVSPTEYKENVGTN